MGAQRKWATSAKPQNGRWGFLLPLFALVFSHGQAQTLDEVLTNGDSTTKSAGLGGVRLQPSDNLGSTNSIKWAGDSKIYEQLTPHRLIIEPNSDRLEIIHEGASGYLASFNGPGSSQPNRTKLYTGVLIGSGSDYAGNGAPPANGLLVEGDVGLGTPNPAHKLDVAGDINVSGDFLKNGVPLPLDGATDDQTASEVSIADASGNFNATDVEGALAELALNAGESGIPETLDYTSLTAIPDPVDGDVVYVTQKNIFGMFVYDSLQSGTNNFGTIINGWVRQYTGDIIAEWFVTGGNDPLNISYALKYALTQEGVPTVKITKDKVIDQTILLDSGHTLDFKGATLRPDPSIDSLSAKAIIKNRNSVIGADRDITIIGGTIDGTGVAYGYDAVRLDSVTNGLVKDVFAKNVHTVESNDSGNFHIVESNSITIDNVKAIGTWKMGVMVRGGKAVSVKNSYFQGTHDSAIGMIDSDFGYIGYNVVDNCGTSGASNVAANLRYGIMEHNTVINGSGSPGVNQHGFTLGHPLGYTAYNSIVRFNHFIDNMGSGVMVQGAGTRDNEIYGNYFLRNGSAGNANSGGVGILDASGTRIYDNVFVENYRGVSFETGATDLEVIDNDISKTTKEAIRLAGNGAVIKDNVLANNDRGISFENGATMVDITDNYISDTQQEAIRNAGSGATIMGNTLSDNTTDISHEATATNFEDNFVLKDDPTTSANHWSDAHLVLDRTDQANNTSVGLTMPTSLTPKYGMRLSTERVSGGTDFKFRISAHKNTEEGTDVFTIDDDGNAELSGTLDVASLNIGGSPVSTANLVTVNMEANSISYDNTASGLSATDLQQAIDELEARLDALEQ